MKSLFYILLIILIFQTNLSAQFTITGEIRPRTEYRHGYKQPPATDAEAAFFVDQRSRLYIDYQTEKVRYFLNLQDVRVWGNQSQLVIGDGYLTGVHEAWATIKFSEDFSTKLGRQEIILDDHRIFGSVAWLQQARSHDAALINYKSDKFSSKLGLAFNQTTGNLFNRDYFTPANYKALQFLWMNYKTEPLNISTLFLNNGLQNDFSFDQGIVYSQTIGTRLSLNHDLIIGNLNFYHQAGKTPDPNSSLEEGIKLNANLLNIEAGVKINDSHSLMAGYESISGNDQINPTVNETNAFNPFYGTNHKFNGFMDLFYVGNHANSVGLKDLYFTYKGNFNQFNLSTTYHAFDSHGNIDDPNSPGQEMDATLGSEIDIVGNYKLNSDVTFTVGYSQYFLTDGIIALRGGDIDETSNWAWLMITIKPTLFTNKETE